MKQHVTIMELGGNRLDLITKPGKFWPRSVKNGDDIAYTANDRAEYEKGKRDA